MKLRAFIQAVSALFVIFGLASCFKKTPVNEFALLHQSACIESIEHQDYDRAKTHCEICLEYDVTMPECLNGIGLISLMANDENKAITYFQRAIVQDNDYSQARNNRGVVDFQRGDFKSALKYFSRALEIDPSNVDARYNIGLTNFRLAERERAHGNRAVSLTYLLVAHDQIKKLLAIEPTYHAAYRDLGLIELSFYEQSEFERERKDHLTQAKAAFTQCIDVEKEEDGCYEGLAQTLLEEGEFSSAFSNYFICLNYAPENYACRHGIVAAYEKSLHTESGYREFKRSIENSPDQPYAHEAFCAALFDRGFHDEAVKECEIALRLKPDLCSAQFRLADYFATTLNVPRAVSYCQSFLICSAKLSNEQTQKCQDILVTLRR